MVVAFQGADKHIENLIWAVQPAFILYFIQKVDCNGFDPMSVIPSSFHHRTLMISKVINEQDLLTELNRRRNR